MHDAHMPKKKTKSSAPRRRLITYRLDFNEEARLESDRAALPGVPVTLPGYARHAALEYSRLRRLEERIRNAAIDDGLGGPAGSAIKDFATDALNGARE